MVRRLGLGKNNHLTYDSLALNPRDTIHVNMNIFQLGFRFLSFSHYLSMGAYVANLDPRGMVGSIYVGDHLT